jgi:hypothetical protein
VGHQETTKGSPPARVGSTLPDMRPWGLLAGVLVLTACGGGGSSGDDVRKAVDGYSQAYLSGDAATAYGMLSTRCQAAISQDQYSIVVAAAKAAYGPQQITTYRLDDAKGSTAHVTYGYKTTRLDQTRQAWVKESGAWRWDGC